MLAAAVPGRITIPVGLARHHLTSAQAAAASQAAVLEQLREKLETGEPPEKKVALTAEEQQRLVQHTLQHNLLAMASQFPMNVKISNRGSKMQHLSLGHPFHWHTRREQPLLERLVPCFCLRQVLVSVSLNAHIGISFPQMTDRRLH